MIYLVDRSKGEGNLRLALLPPTDFSGASLTMQVGWPNVGPGGAWYFRARLMDQFGHVWLSPQYQSTDTNAPATPNANLVPWIIGPAPLPSSFEGGFDSSRVTEIWFDVWLSATPAQQFAITIDAFTLGVPGLKPYLSTQLPNNAAQTLFGGYIASVAMSDRGALDGSVEVAYACRDYKLFTDARNWNKDYTNLNFTDAQIIRDTLTGTALVPSVLTLGNIASTGVLAMNFSYQTVTQVLNAVSKATGLSWYVDANGVFNYVQPDAQPVRVVLSDQPNGNPFRVDAYAEDFFAPANDVTFVGDHVTAHVWDQASIDRYGLLQWVDYDLRVTHADTALTAASTDLARASTPNERGQITCWTVGARPGNVIDASASRYGWSNKQLQVQKVQMRQLGDNAATSEVVITVGDYNPTITDAIASIAKSVASTSGASI